MENGDDEGVKCERDASYASLFDLIHFSSDTPAAIRTRDLQLRRLTLYPAELRVRAKFKIHQGPTLVNHTRLIASREENPVKEEQNQRAENGHQPFGLIVGALIKQRAADECSQKKADYA
jgi:hypothetical protein